MVFTQEAAMKWGKHVLDRVKATLKTRALRAEVAYRLEHAAHRRARGDAAEDEGEEPPVRYLDYTMRIDNTSCFIEYTYDPPSRYWSTARHGSYEQIRDQLPCPDHWLAEVCHNNPEHVHYQWGVGLNAEEGQWFDEYITKIGRAHV